MRRSEIGHFSIVKFGVVNKKKSRSKFITLSESIDFDCQPCQLKRDG